MIAIVIAIDLVVVTTVAILSVQDDGGLLTSQDMSLSRFPLVILFSTARRAGNDRLLEPGAHGLRYAAGGAGRASNSAARASAPTLRTR